MNPPSLDAVTGYLGLDRKGEFVFWCACIAAAKKRFDKERDAQTIVRCSDGCLMAFHGGWPAYFAQVEEAGT